MIEKCICGHTVLALEKGISLRSQPLHQVAFVEVERFAVFTCRKCYRKMSVRVS